MLPTKGRTTREVILPALIELSRGKDVTIVALGDRTRAIAARVARLARALCIPCRNTPEFKDDDTAPRIRVRPYGAPVERDEIPFDPQARRDVVVLIDHSAVFERGCVRASAVRTIDATSTIVP